MFHTSCNVTNKLRNERTFHHGFLRFSQIHQMNTRTFEQMNIRTFEVKFRLFRENNLVLTTRKAPGNRNLRSRSLRFRDPCLQQARIRLTDFSTLRLKNLSLIDSAAEFRDSRIGRTFWRALPSFPCMDAPGSTKMEVAGCVKHLPGDSLGMDFQPLPGNHAGDLDHGGDHFHPL